MYTRRIEQRRNGQLISVLSDHVDIGEASFTLTAQRGCSNGKLSMAVEAGAGYLINRGDEIRLMWDTGDIWYTGFVSTRSRSEGDFKQTYQLRGYADYLSGIFISEDETDVVHFGNDVPEGETSPVEGDNTVEAIVQWLWDEIISSELPDLSLDVIQVTGQQVSHIQFDGNQTVFEILEELSNLGSVEGLPCYFGVDEQKQFYFRRITSASPQQLEVMNDEKGLTIKFDREDFGEIYNVLILTGAPAEDGVRIRHRFESASSIARYRRRVIRIRKDFLTNYADMQKWANGFFAKYSVPFESMEIEQYVDEEAEVLYRPWMSYIKVTTPTGGLQRLSPFSQVDYEFNNRPSFRLSVSRLEDELNSSPDGSQGDSDNNPPDDNPIEATPVDPPTPTNELVISETANLMTHEDGSSDTTLINLSTAPQGKVTVKMQGQIDVTTAEFTVAAGDPVAAVVDDVNSDGAVAIGLTLQDSPKTDVTLSITTSTGGVLVSHPSITFTPLNYDTPQVVTFSSMTPGSTAEIEVALTTTIDNDVDVHCEVETTSEVILSESDPYWEYDMSFDDTTWNSPQTLTVTGIDDDGTIEFGIKLNTRPTEDSTVTVRITVTTGGTDAPYFVTKTHDFVFDDENWDTQQVATLFGVVEVSSTASFSVEMIGSYIGEAVTVVVDLIDHGSENIKIEDADIPYPVTFTSGTWGTPQTLDVTGIPYERKDGNQDFIINVTTSSWDPSFNGLEASITGINIDNDTPGITVSPLESLETAESGDDKDQEIEIVLNSEPTAYVDVTLVSNDEDAGIPSPSTIRFESSNWDFKRDILIVGQDDGIVNTEDRTYTVTITTESTDPHYDNLEVVLTLNHRTDRASGGIDKIVADSTEDSTEVVVDDVSSSFDDMFEPSDELGKLDLTERVKSDVVQEGMIFDVTVSPACPRVTDTVVIRASVATHSGTPKKVKFFWRTTDSITEDVASGTIYQATGDAAADNMTIYSTELGTPSSVITMPANLGKLEIKVSVVSDDMSEDLFCYYPDGSEYMVVTILEAEGALSSVVGGFITNVSMNMFGEA